MYKRQAFNCQTWDLGIDEETLEIRAVEVTSSDVGDAPMPVSYTHLRAHETVLDLVCRLLLEKKHNITNKSLDCFHI